VATDIDVTAALEGAEVMDNTDVFAKLRIGRARPLVLRLDFYAEFSAHAPQRRLKSIWMRHPPSFFEKCDVRGA
jgi:hypothetical protein